MTSPSRWLRNAELETTETEDGVVVYQPSRGRVHSLNAAAAAILELCDGTRNSSAIASELADVFDLAEVPVSLTRGCIDAMAREGLVADVIATEVAPGPGSQT